MKTDASLPSSTLNKSPWANRGQCCFSIIALPAKRHPFTHNAFAEVVDDMGNYQGRELGPFISIRRAEDAIKDYSLL